MDEGAPRASIALFAGRSMELVQAPDGHVLRADDGTLLARMTAEVTVTADGRWTLTGRRGSAIDARRAGSDEIVARYRPAPLSGGVVTVVDGGRYALRAPVLGEAWRLRRGRGRRTLATFVFRGAWDVTLAPEIGSEPDLALLMVVTLEALLVEQLMPHVPHSGGGGG